ncbi:hypothetical protein FACS1894142_8620 [Spirochaetia bacterium]|nr:hypothetical protein FACS1894142_8620 [Spirochaetia bacterium]
MTMTETQLQSSRIDLLRKKIDNKDYLYEAIQRIALILSNELLDISQGGTKNERQRKGRQ